MDGHNKFYLIDGSSYIFRAFFGVRQQLSTSKGFPTNALYGFINMLQKVIRDEKPDYILVAFDSPDKTFRHAIYPEYKANRKVKQRLNRNVDWGTAPQDEQASMRQQMGRLIEYLEYLP